MYKRILTIQDISCLGQCSMTVALPILSACGHETCILPTAMLSTHTGGFQNPAVCHLSQAMPEIREHWLREGITFDAIYTGYLGSIEAIAETEEISRQLLSPGGKLIVDPAMADHGKLYSGFDEKYQKAMKGLCAKADMILPNITEAAMLAELPYEETLTEGYAESLLRGMDHPCVVLTGVGFSDQETGIAVRLGDHRFDYRHKKFPKSYHGTGDLFAACFVGAFLRGKDLCESAKIAADTVCLSISNTAENPAHWYGVKFETAIPYLISQLEKVG